MTPPSAAITVIIPVANGERFLRQAISSVLAQTFPDLAVVVIDDASTDGTGAVLAEFRDPRLRILRNDARLGAAGARNRGLDLADSPYVAFFDSDDVAMPARLATQLEFLERHPDVRLVAARVVEIDDEDRPIGRVWGHTGDASAIAPTMLFRNVLATSTIVANRAWIGAERFDPRLPVASDYDMWVRLLDRGQGACLAETLVRYRVHAGNLTTRRAGDAEDCLRHIAVGRLARLGIQPTEDELARHRNLAAGRYDSTPAGLADVSAWLARVEAGNQARAVYAASALARVLEAEWLHACEAVALAGRWSAWPLIARSPFSRRLLRQPATARSVTRLPWSTLRGSVRRRWPGVGASLRPIRERVEAMTRPFRPRAR